MAFKKTEKLDQGWEIHAVVLEKRTGTGSNGEDWYQVKIGGFSFFDQDLYRACEEGQRVILKGVYTGDRYSKKSGGYSPQHDLEDCIVVEGAFVDPGVKIPHLNGNGLSKGQPA